MRSAWDALVPAWILYALLATLLLATNMPPFQNADELNHFMRADQISRFQFVGERFEDGHNSGGQVASGIQASAAPFDALISHPDRQVTREALKTAERIGWRGPAVMGSFANTSIYPPFLYIPSVISIWFGRLTRMPVVQTLYLARLLTGLACAAAIATALLICTRCGAMGAGLVIFALATLPMSLALQSACSQDGLMLAASALAGALYAQSRHRLRARGVGWMSLCLALVAMARPPYLPLALVPLAAPAGRGARWGGAILVAASSLGWVAIAGAFAMIDTTAGHGANVAAQLRGLLDPAHDAALVAGTWQYGHDYLVSFIGHLGWLDTALPSAYLRAASVLLVLASLAGLRGQRPGSGSALLVVFAVVSSALLVFLTQYITWTPVGLDRVEGVTGRYFLPLALVLAGAFAGLPRGGPERVVLALVLLFPVVSISVALHAIIGRYYLFN